MMMMFDFHGDDDEIKIFHSEEIFDEEFNERLSPLVRLDEETSTIENCSATATAAAAAAATTFDVHHLFSHSDPSLPHFLPYFISPYYPMVNQNEIVHQKMTTSSFERANGHSTWFPSSTSISPQPPPQKVSSSTKKSHIKKPLNAFMLFMKEQRSQVVQECTLRESAAINQILGRKWHELDRHVQQRYYDMARDERLRHMQLYPEWSARDNYGVKKKRTIKGKKRDKLTGDSSAECLNQKKCRARFGLDQQSNWCKHCKRKKKCLRYTENESVSNDRQSLSEENSTDQIDDSNDDDEEPMSDDRSHHRQINFQHGLEFV